MSLAVDTISLPADVRAGGAEARKLYQSALDFEKLLTTQLTKSLADALGTSDDASGGDGGSDADGATGGSGSSSALDQLKSQLPGQLADAVQAGGGLGLAHDLYRSLAAQQGLLTTAAPAAGSAK